MAASEKPSIYRIYLLTVWQEQGQAQAEDGGWRFHLTNPQTGQRYGFTSHASLLTVLQQAINHSAPTAEEH